MVDRRDAREDIVKLQVLTDVMLKQIENERQVVQLFKDSVGDNFGKLEERLRIVERNMYLVMGGLAILQVIFKFIH